MKEKVTSLSSVIKQVIAVLIIGLSVGYAFAVSWTIPPTTPPICPDSEPGCNLPLNVSLNSQDKAGGLTLGSLIVRGGVRFNMDHLGSGADGLPAVGKVLTVVNANGTAEWRDSTGGGGAGTFYVKDAILTQGDKSVDITMERCVWSGYTGASHPCATVDCNTRDQASFGTCRDITITGRKVSYARVMCDTGDVAVSASYLNIANGGRASGLIPITDASEKPIGYECQDISFKGGTCYVTCRK